jgi:hypothetical protein
MLHDLRATPLVESIASTCAGLSIGRCRPASATPTECETLGFGVGETLTGIGSRRCFYTSIGALPHQ